MTAKKETAQEAKAAANETAAESPYFVIRAIQGARGRYEETIKTYRERYEETVKTYRERYMEKPSARAREFTEGLRRDLRKVVDNSLENGKKRLPSADSLRSRFDCGARRVSDKLNLPSRQDIQKLRDAMENLSVKVEKLNDRYSV